MQYVALVHKETASAFGVTVPDCPGCTAAATTLDEVLADPDVPGDAVTVLLPLLAAAGRTERVNITPDAGLLRSIDTAATARGLTRSAFLAPAARDKIAGAG